MPVGPRRGRRGIVFNPPLPRLFPKPTTTNLENNPNMAHVPNMGHVGNMVTCPNGNSHCRHNHCTTTAPAVTRSSIVQTNQNPDLDDNSQNLRFKNDHDRIARHHGHHASTVRFRSPCRPTPPVYASTSLMAPSVPQTPLSIPPSTRSMGEPRGSQPAH